MYQIESIYIGKVRNNAILTSTKNTEERLRLIETTNRISAFDYIFPFPFQKKAAILQALSLLAFEKTKHIIGNHIIGALDATHILVKNAEVFPVEIIVRQYLSGSLWRLYEKKGSSGVFEAYGIELPSNMLQNQKFEKPIMTPSTKAISGHDLPITQGQAQEIVGSENWSFIQQKALDLFSFGCEEALKRGLILVDTKYEMGKIGNQIILVDEIHTPDSSRFWKCGDEKEKNPKQISKEFLREELIQILGHPENFTQNPIYHPELQKKAVRENLASRVSQRYQELFELITGKINPDDIYKEIKFISWPIEKTLFSKAIENQTLPEKILVVGNGGRDFVLSNEFANLSEVNTIYCMAGNRNWSHPKFEMFPMSVPEKISFFAYEMRVGLVIAGPEAPIAKGLEEYCTAQGVPVLSPSLACASLESSKILCKQLVESAGIRTPLSHVLPWSELKPFMEENKLKIPCVLKYDSLASGKGVFVIKNKQDITNALQSIEDNLPTWDKLSQEILTHTYSKIKGEPCFLIEDCIEGEEFSAIALCNGEHYRLLPIAKDYKRRNDNQSGPNTGGMGAMAPVNLSEKLLVQVRNAFDKTLKKLVEKGTPYRGFLFAGFMVDKNQEAHLLEFNCRLGDPETQVVLPSLGREFFAEIYHTAKKQTFLFPEKSGQFFSSDGKKRVFVVGASPEYPEKNAPKRSFILPKWEETKDVKIDFIPSSIEMNNTTTGGRAFGLLGCANSFETARKEIYKIMETIKFENEDGNFVKPHYRTDIGEEK